MRSAQRVGDALGAMYFVAAVMMAIAAIVVVALMFVPKDLFREGGEVWVPATNPAPTAPAPSTNAADPRAGDEELHMH